MLGWRDRRAISSPVVADVDSEEDEWYCCSDQESEEEEVWDISRVIGLRAVVAACIVWWMRG
jgi:hypothetical protein